MNFLLKLDAFRKIPAELTNPTYHGAYLTIAAYALMSLLFFLELHSYLSTSVTQTVQLDKHFDEHIWIDFDVLMYALPCEYANVVVKDIVGTHEVEILERRITKERVEARDLSFKGAADKRKEAMHQAKSHVDHHHAHGEDEEHPELEADWDSTSDHFKHTDFDAVLDYHDFTMVNFYAQWCIHCRRFAPTWKSAEDAADQTEYRDKNRQVVAAKLLRVNCVDFGRLCARLGIRAYPTVRMYQRDKTFTQYTGPRQKEAILSFVQDFIHNQDTGKHEVVSHHSSLEEGCRILGELKVRRVPGYFYVEVDSKVDSLDPAMTNVSHRVSHIYFMGDRTATRNYVKNTAKHVTSDVLANVQAMDQQDFITSKPHTAPEHYLSVVPTKFDQQVTVYQSSVQSHIAEVEITKVPQARFQYHFSPLAVHVSTKGRPLYDFITSLFAIIGGTYTFISLFDKFCDTVSTRYKSNMGKLG